MATERRSKILQQGPEAGLFASMAFLERNSGLTVCTDPLEKDTLAWVNVSNFKKSYLRFKGRFTSPVAISMSTIFVISTAACSGHLREERISKFRHTLLSKHNVFRSQHENAGNWKTSITSSLVWFAAVL